MKFCRYVANVYLHIFTNFGRFIFTFNTIALIFLGVPIAFNVFSFMFPQKVLGKLLFDSHCICVGRVNRE